jgi:hypothetical protein
MLTSTPSKMLSPMVPFTAGSPIMIAGPTGVGKTFFTYKLLTHNMFTEKIKSILYCYGVHQPFYDKMVLNNASFHEGLPNLEKLEEIHDGHFHVIVLDDLMEDIVKSFETQKLFTKYCHHYNLTVIFLTQNVFAKGPCARTISLNTHILVLFGNKRDESQASQLAKQLYPGNPKVFMGAYEDATLHNFGYLIVDCDPKSSKLLKLRTNIFPGQQTIVYLKK